MQMYDSLLISGAADIENNNKVTQNLAASGMTNAKHFGVIGKVWV